MDRRLILLCGGIAVLLCGCHHAAPPDFPNWLARETPRNQTVDQSNAFLGYVAAADQAEKDGAKYLDKVSFTPGRKDDAMKATEGALAKLVEATGRKCDFAFEPLGPFDPAPHQKGWRLLGRDLVWKIEDAIIAKDFDTAVRNTVIATKFGFDLTGGGATDASLGLSIVDEARKAIAPSLDAMGAGQLANLASGVTSALESAPAFRTVIDNEHENMLSAVQYVQDCYQKRSYKDLEDALGSDSDGAIQALQDVERKDATKRPAYFQSFASEADAEADWMRQIADLPAAERMNHPDPKFKGDRPWRKFSRAFFYTLRPLLAVHYEALARTRLLIIESTIEQHIKAGEPAPKDLSGFPAPLNIDPFSGKTFMYHADGKDYRLYSVGADLRDDGGDTDYDTYTAPDMLLETGS